VSEVYIDLMKSETVFALENANWPALLVDASGGIRAASQGAKSVFGEEIAGQSLSESIWTKENPRSAEELLGSFEESSGGSYELKLKMADGSIATYQTQICTMPSDNGEAFLLQMFNSPAAAPVLTSPVKTIEGHNTSITVVDAGVAQKQKLDCAMQLIRTVALDFNNALTSILGHASLLLAKSEQKSPIRSSLVEIEKSAQRAAEIASDLAGFSRHEKDTKAQTSGNLNEVLRRTVEIFKERQPETIHWKLDLQNRPFGAKFDEAKMQQAFIKILENAVQAMDNFGTVYISTRNQEISEPLKDGNARLAPGAYICVEIADTGKGIPEDILPRIFEPFFTTKKDSGHRGLGLAWVYGIVTNHAGSVAVKSEVGKGTSVRVYLPAHKKVVSDKTTNLDDLSGNQTILMIDDEDLLLTMGEMVLSSFGYKVLTANSGAKALEIFAAKSQEIDLVITDLVMPQMSGRELIERLRRHSPQVKVICASGFVRPPSTEEEENYLQKPFASQDLLRKVKHVLSAEERG
jgi:two-component system, cell cycle sensor histidine kinase and response regulator CckA